MAIDIQDPCIPQGKDGLRTRSRNPGRFLSQKVRERNTQGHPWYQPSHPYRRPRLPRRVEREADVQESLGLVVDSDTQAPAPIAYSDCSSEYQELRRLEEEQEQDAELMLLEEQMFWRMRRELFCRCFSGFRELQVAALAREPDISRGAAELIEEFELDLVSAA